MTIAQRPVAREAVARAKTLPMSLIEAQARAFDPLLCLDLNNTQRRALAGILGFYNLKKPNAAIFPSRDRLRADSLISSETTLYRALSALEKFGYIVREQIRLARNGRFYHSPITLTDKARRMLGLKSDGKVIHIRPPAKVEDGQYKEHTNQKHSLQKSPAKQDSRTEIDPQTRIPKPLGPLLGLGLRPKDVCYLMRIAREQGKRLEHVMKAAWVHVAGLKGRAVIAYLSALFRKNQDFEYAVRRSETVEREHVEELALLERLKSIDARFHGFDVVNEKGRVLGQIDATTRTVYLGARGSAPLSLEFAMRLRDGAIRLMPPGVANQAGEDREGEGDYAS